MISQMEISQLSEDMMTTQLLKAWLNLRAAAKGGRLLAKQYDITKSRSYSQSSQAHIGFPLGSDDWALCWWKRAESPWNS